jgi:purine-binding chemotaxis protein CheW
MEVGKNDGTFQVGAVVDSVFEVLNVKAADIEDTPTFGVDIDTNFILGMAKMDGPVKILLDIDLIIGTGEAEMIANAS